MTISELIAASKIYAGNTQAQKVYIGSTQVWSASRLPSGYTELPYISSTLTGGQYMDLGCKLLETADDIRIDIKFKIIGNGKNSTGQSVLLACKKEVSPYPGLVLRTANYSNANLVDTRLDFNTKWEFTNSQKVGSSYFVPNYEGMGSGAPAINDNSKLVGQIVEDTIVFDNIPTTQLIDLNTIVFAGYDNKGVPFRFIEADLYYLKLTKGTQVIRELIPAQRGSDNEVGLYDIQNDVFYYSLGDSPFVAGTAS